MTSFTHLVLAILLVLGGFTHPSFAQVRKPTLKKQLSEQLSGSADVGLAYERRARMAQSWNSSTETQRWESHRYAVRDGRVQLAAGDDTVSTSFIQEFNYATDVAYDDPAIRDLFTTVMHGDTLIALRNRDRVGKCDLVEERTLRTARGTLTFVHVRTERNSTLYHTDTDTKIWFDATTGHYLCHSLTVRLSVKLLGMPRLLQVQGRRL